MTTLNKRNEDRTHEENQERAFIAASHRGDRTLEARMESARKASEIHKKRTGKELHITQQDVLNEEMYREVDPKEEAKVDQFYREVIGEPPQPQGRGTYLNKQ